MASNQISPAFPLIRQVACSTRATTEELSFCFKATASIAREHAEAALVRMGTCPGASALNRSPKQVSRAAFGRRWGSAGHVAGFFFQRCSVGL